MNSIGLKSQIALNGTVMKWKEVMICDVTAIKTDQSDMPSSSCHLNPNTRLTWSSLLICTKFSSLFYVTQVNWNIIEIEFMVV
jgi:hypothetical protein